MKAGYRYKEIKKFNFFKIFALLSIIKAEENRNLLNILNIHSFASQGDSKSIEEKMNFLQSEINKQLDLQNYYTDEQIRESIESEADSVWDNLRKQAIS
jgi:hypothetical protein